MIGSVFNRGFEAVRMDALSLPNAAQAERDQALGNWAIDFAHMGAVRYGVDFPVGAVAAAGDMLVAGNYASDKRTGKRENHAERMALKDAIFWRELRDYPQADSLGISLEPCPDCLEYIATDHPYIERVVFVTPRRDIEKRRLVKRHNESIFVRAQRLRLPFELVQVDSNARITEAGAILFDYTRRDPQSETVEIDRRGLTHALREVRKSTGR